MMKWLPIDCCLGIRRVMAMLLLAVCWLPFKAQAQALDDSARLYAAYTYNFISFASWPNKPANKLTLCVAGQNRDSQLLSQLDGKSVQGTIIEVVNYQANMMLEVCQVLFVASAEFSDLFDRASQAPLLLITNIMPDNGRSSMIRLSTESGRVVFDVNLSMVKRSGLQLPPSLLKLARRVVS